MIINHTITPGGSGSPGVDGITPHIGSNGNWFLGTDDTGVNARGINDTQLYSVVLSASGWDSSTMTQSVSVLGILADDLKQVVNIKPDDESLIAYTACSVECCECAEDTLVFKATYVPQTDLTLYVVVSNTTEELIRDVYSTEETVVGAWIDGKPIYRTCVFFTSPSKTSEAIVYDVSGYNIESLIDIRGAVQMSSTFMMPVNTTYYISMWYSEGLVMQLGSTNYVNKPAYAVIEYTKTTDTATIEIPSATALALAYEEGVDE